MTYPFQSQQTFTAQMANDLPGRVLARARRESNSTGTTTTEIGVLRLDGIPIKAGWEYEVSVAPVGINSTVANDLLIVNLRASTAGAATTASTVIRGMAEAAYSAGGSQRAQGFSVLYDSTVDGTLSVLLSVVRFSGTGTVSLGASAAAPMLMWVRSGGEDPGDTGTEL